MRKKLLIAAVALILAGGTVAYIQRHEITLAMVEKVASERMQNPMTGLDDGLHVGLCGTGSPFPDPDRAAPCTLVIAGKDMFLFDAGSAAAKQIATMGFSTGQLKGVFITHFHSDHIDGLGEVLMTRWAQHTQGQKLTVHGPSGIAEVMNGFETAYRQDTGYRTAHHGVATMPPELAGADVNQFAVQKGSYTTVVQQPDLLIEAFAVNHQPINPAVGYRINYKGRTVVLSGDTTSDV
ncbi:MAG: MBL fold metallo-hydrolase, partial [Gammaproteobacteria bacterium]